MCIRDRQIEDNLSGIRVVKSFANEQLENEKFQIGNKAFLEAKKNNYKYMGGYNAGLIGFNTMIKSVSYTHLDVYKRQYQLKTMLSK